MCVYCRARLTDRAHTLARDPGGYLDSTRNLWFCDFACWGRWIQYCAEYRRGAA